MKIIVKIKNFIFKKIILSLFENKLNKKINQF